MTKTMTPLEEQVEEARAEHLKAVQRVADLEAESVAIPWQLANPPWEEGERAALDSLKELEYRRQAVPHLLKQARKQEAEAELRLLDLQLAEAEEKRPLLEQLVEEKQAEFERARLALNHAKGEHAELVYGVMSDIRRGQHAARERLIVAESEDPSGESKGPVVRSTWQTNMASPDEGNFIQDTPPAFHFGSANVSDTPLSAGEDTPAVVVPQEALANHGKNKRQGGGG